MNSSCFAVRASHANHKKMFSRTSKPNYCQNCPEKMIIILQSPNHKLYYTKPRLFYDFFDDPGSLATYDPVISSKKLGGDAVVEKEFFGNLKPKRRGRVCSPWGRTRFAKSDQHHKLRFVSRRKTDKRNNCFFFIIMTR